MTPLVIGMALCLMLIGAAVTAAGSAYLARQSLQHRCDGAAAAAADGARGLAAPGSGPRSPDEIARSYLAERGAEARVAVGIDGDRVLLSCSGQAEVVFGALFGSPSVQIEVTAVGRTFYRG